MSEHSRVILTTQVKALEIVDMRYTDMYRISKIFTSMESFDNSLVDNSKGICFLTYEIKPNLTLVTHLHTGNYKRLIRLGAFQTTLPISRSLIFIYKNLPPPAKLALLLRACMLEDHIILFSLDCEHAGLIKLGVVPPT